MGAQNSRLRAPSAGSLHVSPFLLVSWWGRWEEPRSYQKKSSQEPILGLPDKTKDTQLTMLHSYPVKECSVSILCLLRHKMIQELQHARFPCPSLSSGVCSDSCPLSWWHYLTISSSDSSSPFAFNLSQHQGLFQWVVSSHLVATVLEFQLQHQSF